MKKNLVLIFILLLVFTLILSINAGAAEDILKIRFLQRPFNLNPIYSSNKTELKIINNLFDNLISYNSKGELTANLAKSWEVNQRANRFIFKLRKDVFFNKYSLNNREISPRARRVTAADWKWSLEYLADPENKSPFAYLLNKVEGYDDYRQKKSPEITGIKVTADYKLEINLKESYAPFIYNLAQPAAVVMPKKAVLESQNFSLKPIGTGAFSLNYFSGNKIILNKNDDYWQNDYLEAGIPALNKIEIIFAADNLDYSSFDIYELSQEEYLKYKRKNLTDAYQLKKIASNNLFYLALNYKSQIKGSLLSEKDADRLSLYLKSLINENDFMKSNKINSFLEIKRKAADSLLKDLPSIYQNQAVLNEELELESLNINSLNLISNNSKLQQKSSALIKNILADNLNLKLQQYNWVEYLNKLKSDKKTNLFLMTYNFENKFDFFYDNFHSESELNYYNYHNNRIDNLLDYLILFSDQEKSKRAYKRIEMILENDNPYLFILKSADNYLINSQLNNLDKLDNIYLKGQFKYLKFNPD